jgi:hypothetical protein
MNAIAYSRILKYYNKKFFNSGLCNLKVEANKNKLEEFRKIKFISASYVMLSLLILGHLEVIAAICTQVRARPTITRWSSENNEIS